MSAIAEPPAALIDDRLARRNAMVLAVAQALAGGNNTVIVATAGIIGTDARAGQRSRDTADLGHGARACGSARCRSAGWRAATAAAPRCRSAPSSVQLAGLVCCVAVLQGSFALLLLGTFGCGFYAAGA